MLIHVETLQGRNGFFSSVLRHRHRIVGRFGFTLIELLVVVAIISLLVSILLPSLTKAKELAKRVVCQSNQKHTGTYFALFAQDNDDYIAAQRMDVNWGTNKPCSQWYDFLACFPDFGRTANTMNKVTICPANKTMITEGVERIPITNYGQPNTLAWGFYAQRWPSPPPYPEWGPPYKFTTIQNPADKVILTETNEFNYNAADPSFFYAIDAYSARTSWLNVLVYRDEIAKVHNEGTNSLFGDLHVEWLDWDDLADPSNIVRFYPDWK